VGSGHSLRRSENERQRFHPRLAIRRCRLDCTNRRLEARLRSRARIRAVGMAPPGVSIHASRVPYNHDARSFAESPNVDTATERLVGLAPHVIVYAYTGSSYVLGAEADDALRVRLEKRARGIPVVLTTSAASEALGLLRVHRLALRSAVVFRRSEHRREDLLPIPRRGCDLLRSYDSGPTVHGGTASRGIHLGKGQRTGRCGGSVDS
jgi:hypothetical protein